MKKVDFIIVGQGIAGTTVAHSIEKKGASYIIIDNYSNKSSSFAAAGVFHPFSFKRLVLSWQANTFISKAIRFYSTIEEKLNESLFSKHVLYRIFSSFGEQNSWNSKKKLSTYASFIDETNKKNKLLKKVATLGDFEFKVVDQKAGVRPTTKDRRPLIGKHPTLENMYIFNGLGSKGVMLAPFLSTQLIDSILTGSKIDPEADISRYTQKHFNYN